MKQIPVGKNKVALVDDEDYGLVSKFVWLLKKSKTGICYAYAQRRCEVNGKKVAQFMHRLIMGITVKTTLVDHRDRDGLNNQKCNLRIANRQGNRANARKQGVHTSSRFKGVYWDKGLRKWQAQIAVNGKMIHLGVFEQEIDAARAYDRSAQFYFQNFARTNQMERL